MKKYNKCGTKWAIIWIVVPILCFFLSMNIVYAVFTASASTKGKDFSSGRISITFRDTDTRIQTGAVTDSTYVVPNSEITVLGKLVNAGNKDLFALIIFEIKVDGVVLDSRYCTATGGPLYHDAEETNSTSCTTISAGTYCDFELKYSFDWNDYGNEYQGKMIEFSVSAMAVQCQGLTGVEATNILLD